MATAGMTVAQESIVTAPPVPEPTGPPGITVTALVSGAATAIRSFAHPQWVVGEVGDLAVREHAIFFSLSDERSTIQCVATGRNAGRVQAILRRAGTPLANGLQIRAQGQLHVQAQRGRLQFMIDDVDPSTSIGTAIMAKRELLERLRTSGELARQRELAIPAAPLRVVLIGPPAQGLDDVLARLRSSPWAWSVRHIPASASGPKAPAELAEAITRAASYRPDVIVLVRGGGEAATAAFDVEQVALAICACPVPVICAVGHNADRSVADECAAVSVATPTAAAAWLCDRIEAVDAQIVSEGRAIVAGFRARFARQEREIAEAMAGLEADIARKRAAAAQRAVEQTATASRRHLMAALVVIAVLVVAVLVLVL